LSRVDLLKAAQIDPGAAIAAFAKANHTLALAHGRSQTPDRIAAIQWVAAPAKPVRRAAWAARSPSRTNQEDRAGEGVRTKVKGLGATMKAGCALCIGLRSTPAF